jgi:cob(I)alamin adenosyltransferase
VSKGDLRIACCGAIDELNAHAGLLSDFVKEISLETVLPEIQNTLFVIGSAPANDGKRKTTSSFPRLREDDIILLENEIDKMSAALTPIKHFIFPRGHAFISQAHIARAVCRRAERLCVKLYEGTNDENLLIIKYLNRLSDYFFVLARYLAHTLKVAETVWIPK